MRIFIALFILSVSLSMSLQVRANEYLDKFSGEWEGDGRIWLIQRDSSSQTKCGYSAYHSRHKPPVDMQGYVDSTQSIRMEVKHLPLDHEKRVYWPGYHDAQNSYHTACLLKDTLLLYRSISAPEDMPVRKEGDITYTGPWDSAEWLEIKISENDLKADVWRQETETITEGNCYFSGCGELKSANDLRYSFSLVPVGKEPTIEKIVAPEPKIEKQKFKSAEGAAVKQMF